jgi:REP element-mobilizing transposase RayT
MARPLRIEFAGALYHITARGNDREAIYLDDLDRKKFLGLLSEVCRRFNWLCRAYCLMENHYHLLIETPEANLSQGMRQLNGVYTQSFNRLHNRVGHVFQGRYKAILVQKESYLLELARYIVLNPVRAQMVRSAKDWPWSSYRAAAGLVQPSQWLEIDWILAAFGRNRSKAIKAYRKFVSEGRGLPSPWVSLRNQIYLGDDAFVGDMQGKLSPKTSLTEIPSSQKRLPPKPLLHYQQRCDDRNEAIVAAYQSGGYSMVELASHFDLHYSSVSKIIKKAEDSQFKT